MQISPSSPTESVDRVDQHDRVAGQRAAHRAEFHLLAGGVADLGGRLGLPVPVPDGDAPGVADLLDHLGVERLTGRDALADLHLHRGQIGLDQHPPDRRRCAEGGHAVRLQDLQHLLGVEARVVVEEDGRARVPRGEDVAPRVLRPAGGGDVEVDVAGLEADPVHGRQVTDRVADLRVLDQLRLARRTGGEVEEQRVVRGRVHLGHGTVVRRRVVVVEPTLDRRADGDADAVVRDPGVPAGLRAAGDDGPYAAALDPVREVGVGEQRGRGDHHRAGPDAAEHDLPQRDRVAEHDQDPVARLQPGLGEPAGHLTGSLGHLGVRPGVDLAVLLDDGQRRDLGLLDRERVEPVPRPVEPVEVPAS